MGVTLRRYYNIKREILQDVKILLVELLNVDTLIRILTSLNQDTTLFRVISIQVSNNVHNSRFHYTLTICTCGGESQLSTGNLSIRSAPQVITHCAPLIAVANLHTSTSGSASLQSDSSLSTSCTCSYSFRVCVMDVKEDFY